jgi:UDP-GlcNAc3NAcA epimerase
VYGDTNSTLAGALTATKLDIPIAHIEAGLRSFNRQMPEEINRVITDRISQILFVPSMNAVKNLYDEGISNGVYDVGDIMYDAVLFFLPLSDKRMHKLKELAVSVENYYFATIHRPSNTDDENTLNNILQAFSKLDKKVIFPIHPRTKKMIDTFGIKLGKNIIAHDPVGYIDSLMFINNAKAVLTDSGGMQKEAFYLKTPCITIRSETEWTETISQGWNQLVESDEHRIINAVTNLSIPETHEPVYGDGNTAISIKEILLKYFKK